jgi:DNA-binding transcriptional LysR family regulator
MEDPDWDDIRCFFAVVEAGSLSGAARTLGVEHTTVARRIGALEAALGVRLFGRRARDWTLTPEGERLAAHRERIAGAMREFVHGAADEGELAGSVRLSAPPLLASTVLAPWLPVLQARFPAIALDLQAEAREARVDLMEADLALRLGRPVQPDLAARPLAELGFGLYASAAYLASHAPSQWRFIGNSGALANSPQQQWLDGVAGTRPYALRTNDLATARAALAAGLGVGVLPHFAAGQDLEAMAEPRCPLTRTLWLVLHPDRRSAPRIRAVADALAERFGAP